MNNRLKQVRKEAGLTQEKFGEKLGLKRNYIYMLESEVQPISNRVVSDVCRIFGVREEWLRSGIEPMYSQNSKTALAIQWATAQLSGEDTFQRRFLEALSGLNDTDWFLIESFIEKLNRKSSDD